MTNWDSKEVIYKIFTSGTRTYSRERHEVEELNIRRGRVELE